MATKKAPAPAAPVALSPRHRAFVDAYKANGGNGAAAARTAGFAKAMAKVRAIELLRRPDVRAALGLEPKKGTDKTAAKPVAAAEEQTKSEMPTTADAASLPPIMTRDEVLALWSSVARGVDANGAPLKLGTRDRLEASRLVAKAIGVFDPGSKGDEGQTDTPEWAPVIAPNAAPVKEEVDAPDDVDLNEALVAEVGAKNA